MNRTARVALIAGGLALGMAAPAFAQTATANLGVSATVAKNCSITTTAVAFGAYDPIVANAAAPLDGTGSVVVTCTKGAGTRIDLGLGANATGTTRRMTGGGDFLTYELYTTVARTTVWGTGAGGRSHHPGGSQPRGPHLHGLRACARCAGRDGRLLRRHGGRHHQLLARASEALALAAFESAGRPIRPRRSRSFPQSPQSFRFPPSF